jgi:hypothetical protein
MSAATLASLIPITGLAYVFFVPMATLWEGFILALSTVSYTLMTISYFLYARKLRAATWFAPFWFLVQPLAAILTLLGVRKAHAPLRPGKETLLRNDRESRSNRRDGGRSRETSR